MASTSRRRWPRLIDLGSTDCGIPSRCAAIATRRAWAADSSTCVRSRRLVVTSAMLPSHSDSASAMACWLLVASSSVRAATVDDARTIAELQLSIWRQAFVTVLPPSSLDTDASAHAESWKARIEQGGPVMLAVEGGETVGFAAMHTSVDPRNLLEPVGEIEVLHVAPRWGRRGHGGRLLVSAAAELRRRGARTGWWWIPQVDTATARFLAAAGWAEDGVRRELDTGGAPIIELRWSGTLDLVAI